MASWILAWGKQLLIYYSSPLVHWTVRWYRKLNKWFHDLIYFWQSVISLRDKSVHKVSQWKKKVWVVIYIFQGLQIFKCGRVRYTLFPDSKINILHFKKIIETQICLESYSDGVEKKTFRKKRLSSVACVRLFWWNIQFVCTNPSNEGRFPKQRTKFIIFFNQMNYLHINDMRGVRTEHLSGTFTVFV